MATKEKAPETTIEDGVRGFSMVLRESIMDYYKGTCVQGFGSLSKYHVGQSRIPLPNDGTRRNFNYERDEHQRRNPIAYYLNDQKMFELWRDDHEAIFHPSVMRRSDELSTAYDQLQAFFQKFLQGVAIIERDEKNSKNYTDGSRDRTYIYRSLSEQVSDREEEDEYEEDYEDFSQAPAPQPRRSGAFTTFNGTDRTAFYNLSQQQMQAYQQVWSQPVRPVRRTTDSSSVFLSQSELRRMLGLN